MHFRIKKLTSALVGLLFSCFYLPSSAQPEVEDQISYGTSAIYHQLEKLKVCGTVLYVAAHPDDENTRLITYLANERKFNTVYLSLTRGDGGQNLIGKEQGEAIGIIRTHELLQARRIDGGRQHFTRAYDFGYSKSAEETFAIWNKEEVLADVVWAIRLHQPDVIITRFPEDGSGGHGHHTASALLAREAFKLAGDSTAFRSQLKWLKPWKPTRLFWNGWVAPGASPGAQMESMLKVDVGLFNPVLGKSYTEIAGESRSMHKSQGFGAAQTVGSRIEYLQLLEGPSVQSDFMERILTDWSRITTDKKTILKVDQIVKTARSTSPESLVLELTELYRNLLRQPESNYRNLKMKDLKNLILSACGIKAELLFSNPLLTPLKKADYTLWVTNRSLSKVEAIHWSIQSFSWDTLINKPLLNNQPLELKRTTTIPDHLEASQPGWLKSPKTEGMFSYEKQEEIGLPIHSGPIQSSLRLKIENLELEVPLSVVYKYTDPVKGEVTETIKLLPSITIKPARNVYFTTEKGLFFPSLTLSNHSSTVLNGTLLWMNEKKEILGSSPIQLAASEVLSFQDTLSVAKNPKGVETIFPLIVTQKDTFETDLENINYSHIGKQVWFPRAEIRIISEQVFSKAKKVGYISGPGDEVAEGLKAMGIQVMDLDPELVPSSEWLKGLDAIVIGVRAYNTSAALKSWTNPLIQFAEQGGVVLVQYQVSRGLLSPLPFPYTLELGRGRVTEERALVKLTGAGKQFFETPNKMDEADWSGWVQERGLYFAQSWDDRFIQPMVMSDTKDKDEKGSLLILPYGKGMMIYTGLSFFRQIPAGVPGAYKLLGNLISTPVPAKP